MANNSYNVIDLFCGAGGLHIGFEKVGYNIKLCIDNDSLVEKTHKRNYSHIPLINRDIIAPPTKQWTNYAA